MKKQKKLFALTAGLLTIPLALSACGGTPASTPGSQSAAAPSGGGDTAEPVTISNWTRDSVALR